jgi:hypothetical protein
MHSGLLSRCRVATATMRSKLPNLNSYMRSSIRRLARCPYSDVCVSVRGLRDRRGFRERETGPSCHALGPPSEAGERLPDLRVLRSRADARDPMSISVTSLVPFNHAEHGDQEVTCNGERAKVPCGQQQVGDEPPPTRPGPQPASRVREGRPAIAWTNSAPPATSAPASAIDRIRPMCHNKRLGLLSRRLRGRASGDVSGCSTPAPTAPAPSTSSALR